MSSWYQKCRMLLAWAHCLMEIKEWNQTKTAEQSWLRAFMRLTVYYSICRVPHGHKPRRGDLLPPAPGTSGIYGALRRGEEGEEEARVFNFGGEDSLASSSLVLFMPLTSTLSPPPRWSALVTAQSWVPRFHVPFPWSHPVYLASLCPLLRGVEYWSTLDVRT